MQRFNECCCYGLATAAFQSATAGWAAAAFAAGGKCGKDFAGFVTDAIIRPAAFHSLLFSFAYQGALEFLHVLFHCLYFTDE
jgi:hypothetical protein